MLADSRGDISRRRRLSPSPTGPLSQPRSRSAADTVLRLHARYWFYAHKYMSCMQVFFPVVGSSTHNFVFFSPVKMNFYLPAIWILNGHSELRCYIWSTLTLSCCDKECVYTRTILWNQPWMETLLVDTCPNTYECFLQNYKLYCVLQEVLFFIF